METTQPREGTALTWPQVVVVFNYREHHRQNFKPLTRQTAVRLHDRALAKMAAELKNNHHE